MGHFMEQEALCDRAKILAHRLIAELMEDVAGEDITYSEILEALSWITSVLEGSSQLATGLVIPQSPGLKQVH